MKQFYIYTFGCQMNQYDSQKMAILLEAAGWSPAEKAEAADVVIVNTCSVRQKAEIRAIGRLHILKKLKKKKPELKIIVAGCTAQYNPELIRKEAPFVDLVVGTFNQDKILEYLNGGQPLLELNTEKTRPQNKYLSTKQDPEETQKCLSPQGREAFVAIMFGCNNYCAYCVVPFARGPEVSRPAPEIIAEIKKIDFKKFPILVLLGQNVNSYRWENHDFADLLEEVHKIEGPAEIEFMTSHPKDTSDKLIQTIKKLPKISRTIHLPLQSGDNQILKLMNRHYTVEDYKNLVAKIRREIPGVRITTDIIAGFPGETEEQFQNTVRTIRQIGFGRIICTAFSPRPKTAAASLPGQLATEEKARRLQVLLKLVDEVIKAKL